MNIRESYKVLITLFMTVLLLTQMFTNCVVNAETNKDNPGNSSNIINYIDVEMNKLVGNKLAKGVTASIIQNNELVLSKGYGYSDEKTGREVDPENTIFKIGSVSKWYEGTQWQLFVILSFIAFGLVGFILAAVCVISGTINKRGQYPVLMHLPFMAVFLIFVSMVIRFIFYMDYMNKVFGDLNCLAGLDGVISFYKVAAPMIGISGLGGIASTVFL